MSSVDYAGLLRLAAPEAILALSALVVLLVDLVILRSVARKERRWMGAGTVALGCLAAGLWLVQSEGGPAAAGSLVAVDPLGRWVKLALVGLTLFHAGVSLDSDFTDHIGEYFALVLLATVGMMFLVSAEHLLMIFVALELTSLSLYVLTALNKANPRSTEAGLKYFLFGGMAAAFALFGFSLLYGLTGSLELSGVAAGLKARGWDALAAVALVLVVIGFGFKIAAVPFHLWAPDAYEGAPTPSAALIASSSKVASFFLLAKFLSMGWSGLEGSGAWGEGAPGWVPLLAVIAAVSVGLGNLAALAQSSVKRLLAYSAIAHAGYTLVGVVAGSSPGVVAVVYYVVTYAAAALGAFGVLALVETADGQARWEDLAGLSRRAPWAAACLMVFILSLAGIPPLAGFYGKFALFAAALDDAPGRLGLLWLVVVAVAGSTVSLYYYLQVLKQAFVVPPSARATPAHPSAPFQAALIGLALVVVVLGVWPDLLVGRLAAAAAAMAW